MKQFTLLSGLLVQVRVCHLVGWITGRRPGHRQSHYREVPRWEIFMGQELIFELDLGRLAVLKKMVWTKYEQLMRVVFSYS